MAEDNKTNNGEGRGYVTPYNREITTATYAPFYSSDVPHVPVFLHSVNPWSQLEIYVLQEEISKQIQKCLKQLSRKDWKAIAAGFNNRVEGVTLKQGAIMAAARVSATGQMCNRYLNDEDRKLGYRSINEIRLQVKQTPAIEKGINDMLIEVGILPRSHETLDMGRSKGEAARMIKSDHDLPDTEREEETDEDESYGDESGRTSFL